MHMMLLTLPDFGLNTRYWYSTGYRTLNTAADWRLIRYLTLCRRSVTLSASHDPFLTITWLFFGPCWRFDKGRHHWEVTSYLLWSHGHPSQQTRLRFFGEKNCEMLVVANSSSDTSPHIDHLVEGCDTAWRISIWRMLRLFFDIVRSVSIVWFASAE